MIFLSRINFAIFGGDYRYKYLYELLKSDGYGVKVYDNINVSESEILADKALCDADVLITPIPFSKDNKNVILNTTSINIDDLINMINHNSIKTVIGGVINSDIRKKFNTAGITIYDFFSFEEVAIKNAIPTAEGAIMTAMQESDKTLFGSRVLVMGYGRCGKILSSTLKGIGANVSVTYRKQSDKAYIDAGGMQSVNIKEIISFVNYYDFIFNTIPAKIIDKEILKRISKEAIIIDLAQAPGGVDYSYAKKLNIKSLYCPGMPGRTAPYTAADILKNIVVNIAMDV